MADGTEVWAGLVLYWIAPAVAAALLLSRKRRVAIVPDPADRVLAHLAYRIRLAGFRVREGPAQLSVRLGSTSAVKLLVQTVPGGTEVRYQADATKSGWGTIAFLIALFWTSPAALGVVLAVSRRVRGFVSSQVRPALPEGKSLPPVRAPDDISVLLVNGLAEQHRLAAEAYEAQRARYWDLHGVNVLVAMFVGLAAFFFAFDGSTEPDFGARAWGSLQVALAAALAYALPVALLLRIRLRPALLRQRQAERRTHDAWARAARPSASEGASSFEALVENSREIPGWVSAVQRAGLSGDPGAGFVILALGFVAVYALWYALDFASLVPVFPLAWVVAVAAAAVGAGAIVGGYVFYSRWKRRRDAQLAASVADWNARFEALRARMEQFLDGL